MYYYMYKLIDTANGKYYIGVHKTSNLNDGYMGSGVRLNATIRSRCTKQILEFFETEEQMFEREKQVVNEEVVRDPQSYNMCIGGYGGDTISLHPNIKEIIEKTRITRSNWSNETRSRINQTKSLKGEKNGMYGTSRTGKSNPMYNKKHSERTKKLISEKAKERFASNDWVSWNKGIPCSDKQKEIISKANSRIFKFIKDGKEIVIHNLADFCRKNNLNEMCMRHVAAGRNKQHKGYHV